MKTKSVDSVNEDLSPLIKVSSPELCTAPLTIFNIRDCNVVLLLHIASSLCVSVNCVLWFV